LLSGLPKKNGWTLAEYAGHTQSMSPPNLPTFQPELKGVVRESGSVQ
jgi:hypothetical protein